MKKYFGYAFVALSVVFTSCEKDTVDDGGENGNGNGTPTEVLGCTDENATNYNSEATTDDGSCEFPVAYTISGEWNITSLVYETEIDLSSIDPSTLPEDIAPFIGLLGDNIPIEGEADDAGVYTLNFEDYSYVSALSFDTEPVPVFGAIELPSMPINTDSEGTWELQNNDEELVLVDATTGAQQIYEIVYFTEDYLSLKGSLIMPMDVDLVGNYEFEVELDITLQKE